MSNEYPISLRNGYLELKDSESSFSFTALRNNLAEVKSEEPQATDDRPFLEVIIEKVATLLSGSDDL